MRIGTEYRDRTNQNSLLHPALGLGEDWNTPPAELLACSILHPALGLGEDWNFDPHTKQFLVELHPALGLGEDWNIRTGYRQTKWYSIAPGFRAG